MPPTDPQTRLFYILPKVHKDPADWSKPLEIPLGRLIVSDCNSENYASAQYIDYFLNPLSTRHPSYIKDRYNFITKIRALTLPKDSHLFTMDITSLYTTSLRPRMDYKQ